MSTGQLLIVCITTLALAGIAAATVITTAAAGGRRSEDLPPARVGHRVTVHTKQPDDATIFGVVVGDHADRLSLDDAELVTPNGTHPLPGRQDIAVRDISWIDVHALVATPAAERVSALVGETVG